MMDKKESRLIPGKAHLLSTTRHGHSHAKIITIMITLDVSDFNNFSQEFYDSVVNALDLHQLECSCRHSGCLSVHGYYGRSVITDDGKVKLRIRRVRCSECGKTHALLLLSLVPYSQVFLEDQRTIVQDHENGENPNAICSANGLDENNVKSIILRYRRFWQQRLQSESIFLDPIRELITGCFALYGMQFMQIRRTPNKLFSFTT